MTLDVNLQDKKHDSIFVAVNLILHVILLFSEMLKMFIYSNEEDLNFMNTTFSSHLPKQINMFDFVNNIILEVYKNFSMLNYQGH